MDCSDCKHVCMLPAVPSYNAAPPTASAHPYRLIMSKLRSLRLPWSSHHGSVAFIRSAARLRGERARAAAAPVLHPYSLAALAADAGHAALTAALLMYAPFQVFTTCPDPYDPFILFTDAVSFLHILFSFAIGYVADENRQIVLSPRAIAKHYCRTYFLPDLMGALPLQVIELFDECRYPSNTVMLILKLFKLPTCVRQVRNLMEQMELTYVKRTILAVIMKVVVFFHWMTFIYYQVPCFSVHYYKKEERQKVWLKRFSVLSTENDTLFQKYISNLFLVCGLCIGSGLYDPVNEHLISELILTSLMGLAGMVFLTYAFSALLQLCIYKQYERNLYNGRSRELKEYMNFKRLPQFLQRKVQLFINYKYNGHYFVEDVIMNTINDQIKQDINMYGCKKMVMSVPLFQDMPIALINAIVFHLTQALFMPGETLVKAGEAGSSMFMISSGTVAVVNALGREMSHMRDGSYFGEGALLRPGSPRPATIFAIEITEIYKLESADFQSCVQPYPHLRRRLENHPGRRLAPHTADHQAHTLRSAANTRHN